MRRRRKLRIVLAAATVFAAAAGTITAFAVSSTADAAAAPGTSLSAVAPVPASAAAASSPLEAAADAVHFHRVVDLSAGNVEGLPADTRLLPPSASLFAVGSEAPDFTLSTPQGERVRLSAFRGKTVLLEFFATWCPHCQAEVPHLESLRAELDPGAGAATPGAGAAPVVFLSVNADSEDAASVYAFDRYYNLPWPSLVDPGGQPGSFNASGGAGTVTAAYGVAMYPTFYIIDARGRVAWRADREQPDALIRQAIQAAAGG